MCYFKRKISIFSLEVMCRRDGKKSTREATDPEFKSQPTIFAKNTSLRQGTGAFGPFSSSGWLENGKFEAVEIQHIIAQNFACNCSGHYSLQSADASINKRKTNARKKNCGGKLYYISGQIYGRQRYTRRTKTNRVLLYSYIGLLAS